MQSVSVENKGRTATARGQLVPQLAGDVFDARKFAENFEALVNAAGSAKQLKELVLKLAVSGGLSSVSDETADSLLAQLQRQRLLLGKNGVRIGELSQPVAEDEAPYAIPPGWRWIRLRDLGGFLGGGTPSKSNASFWEGPLPWVSPKDMKRPYIDDAEDHISTSAVEGSAVKLIPTQSILYVVRGMILAHSFPVAIATREVTINQDMKALVLALPALSEFILRSCQAARTRVLAKVEHSSHGTCRLASEVVEMLPIALPPLAEQKRIVARVDQLVALIDDLEAKQTKKRDLGARFTKAALEALTTAEAPEDFDTAWQRVVENFPTVIDRAEKVAEIRRTVLDLAATARLVAPTPGSATMALAAVQGKTAGTRPIPERISGQNDWAEERGWLHVPLSATLQEPLANGRSVPDDPRGFPVLRLSALRGRFIDFNEKKLGAWTETEAAPYVVKRGDVLFVRGNGAIRLVGRACLVGDAPENVAFPDTAIRARLRNDVMDPNWLWYVWESRFVRNQIEAQAKTTAGIFKVSQDVLYAITLPVPTLIEQQRIVAKVEHLMKLCDDLEAKLRRAGDRASKLVEAVVQEMVA